MKITSVLLPERYVEGLDLLVKRGLYASRADAIRHALRDFLDKEIGLAEVLKKFSDLLEGSEEVDVNEYGEIVRKGLKPQTFY